MAEAPEVPEAKDPFERRVAISIAIIAVLLSYVSMRGDNAKTDAVIETSKAADSWARYQSKSLKQNIRQLELDLLAFGAPAAPDAAKRIEQLKADMARYEAEMKEITAEANGHQEEAKKGADLNDRSDLAGLFLQIAIVVSSVAILSRQRFLWWAGLGLAVFGALKFFVF